MRYLIKFDFGPVQDFIAAARKIEDLWSGSRMLGDLVSEVHEYVTGKNGIDIIYPAGGSGSEVNLPNVFLAVVENGPPPSVLAGEIEEKARAVFAAKIRTWIEKGGCLNVREIMDRQIRGFLDVSWAASELNGDFHSALENLYALFAAVKKTRTFPQLMEPGIKCTLHPGLSALVPSALYETKINPDKGARMFWKKLGGRNSIPKEIQNAIKSEDGERFSAIGLAKRMYRRDTGDIRFPSTYSMATAMWRLRLLEEAGKNEKLRSGLAEIIKACNAFFECLAKTGFQNTPSRMASKTIPALSPFRNDHCGELLEWEPQLFVETEPGEHAGTPEKKLMKQIRTLVKLANDAKLGEPPKHYALILADGDFMGEIVRSCKTRQDLETLSARLRKFADAAVHIVRDREVCGREIYAGGDDLLAAAPVESALKTACEWRKRYREIMGDFSIPGDGEAEGHSPAVATLSVAVMIAPVNYPLNRLLREARHSLENDAKGGIGADKKDALSISVIKGGGEACSVILPAGRNTENPVFGDFGTWADEIAEIVGSKGVSSKSVHDLKIVAGQIDAAGAAQGGLMENIVTARLLTNRELSKANIETIRTCIAGFFEGVREYGKRFSNPSLLADTLLVLRNMRRLSCL